MCVTLFTPLSAQATDSTIHRPLCVHVILIAHRKCMSLDMPALCILDTPYWAPECGNKLSVCRDGKVIPWDLIKRGIEATHPYSVFMVRSMLAVPFFEKALYELPEDQVTPDHVTALADSIEKDVEGGLAGRSDTFELCISKKCGS